MKITTVSLAKYMHDRYEHHSKNIGWETQESCKVEFDKLPLENKKTMLLVALDIINEIDKEYTIKKR